MQRPRESSCGNVALTLQGQGKCRLAKEADPKIGAPGAGNAGKLA
jgi:hypothetical protein